MIRILYAAVINAALGGDAKWKRNRVKDPGGKKWIEERSSDLKRGGREKRGKVEDTVVLVRSRLSTASIDERGEESRCSFRVLFRRRATFESGRVSEVSRILAYRVRFHRGYQRHSAIRLAWHVHVRASSICPNANYEKKRKEKKKFSVDKKIASDYIDRFNEQLCIVELNVSRNSKHR